MMIKIMIENYNIKRQIIIQINPLFFVNIGLSYYNQCFFMCSFML